MILTVIRSRLEELQRERRNSVAVSAEAVYYHACGAKDATEAPNRCTGMCGD